MNNQRWQSWRLRLSLWWARQRARWHAWWDSWRVPRVVTNRWFVVGAYFLVIMLVSLAWFSRALNVGSPVPDSKPYYLTNFFYNPDDDIAPPILPPPPAPQPADSAPAGLTDPQQGAEDAVPANNPTENRDGADAAPGSEQPDMEEQDAQAPLPPVVQPQNQTAALIAEPGLVLTNPVDGDVTITNPYSTVARQSTLNDWRSHLAIDFEATGGTDVRAAAAGTVKQIVQDDILWGTMVIIEHAEGYVTSYCSLQDLAVRSGEWVAAGQALGRLANNPPVEQMEMSHLHFVLTKDGKPVDPTDLFVK